jgi:hypothetical protein
MVMSLCRLLQIRLLRGVGGVGRTSIRMFSLSMVVIGALYPCFVLRVKAEMNFRWRCCMCNMSNEVPQLFDWDQARNQPGDRWARAELNHSVVEFVAPTEYMVRPPQPAVYVFLIDVSHAAVQSGQYMCQMEE